MRILNVKANMHPVWGGGTAERALQMSRSLGALSGVQVTLLTMDFGLTPDWFGRMQDVEVVTFPCLNARFNVPLVRLGRIDELMLRADVVHLMGHWTLLNALVYRSGRRMGKPYAVSPAGSLLGGGRSRWLKRIYSKAVGESILRNADRLIAITEDERAELRARGYADAPIVVIPNGIHPAEYRFKDDEYFRSSFGLGDRPFVLFMGRLNPTKGPDLLVEAFAGVAQTYSGYNLVLAGPDEGMGPDLTRLARRLGIEDRVRFIGFVSGKEKSMALHAADLLAIPSRHEAMSIVVLESGSAGTPVVVTDRCGLDEVREIGGGFVVPATVEGLRHGLESALQDPAALEIMGDRLRSYTVERFSWRHIGNQFADLFDEILSERTRGASQLTEQPAKTAENSRGAGIG